MIATNLSTRVSLHAQITLDATQSSLFPLPTEERANRRGNARLEDIMDIFGEKGLDSRSTGFDAGLEEKAQWRGGADGD